MNQPTEAIQEENDFDQRGITFCGMHGDVTLLWDKQNDEKVKELVARLMKKGYAFFTMRKVVIDAVQIKRKVGEKGVKTLDNLIIDDETFEKIVASIGDDDATELMKLEGVGLGKRRDRTKSIDTTTRVKKPEEVIRAKQAVAIKPVVGG